MFSYFKCAAKQDTKVIDFLVLATREFTENIIFKN